MAMPSEVDGSRQWRLERHGARLGRVRREMGAGCEAEQAGGRRIDDALKVVAVASGENVREWKNRRCLLGPIDE
jgi:hypothetical protein